MISVAVLPKGSESTLDISQYDKEIKIVGMKEVENNVREVVFKISQKIYRDKSTMGRGHSCFADIMDTQDGPRIIYFWASEPEFEMIMSEIQKSNIFKEEIDRSKALESMVRKKIMENSREIYRQTDEK